MAAVHDAYNMSSPSINVSQVNSSELQSQTHINTFYLISTRLFLYGIPILVALGSLGNVLCIVTMCSDRFRSTSMAFLLTALSLVDLTALYTAPIRRWLIVMSKFDVRVLSLASCKIHFFLSYYTVHLSAWTLVLITLERLVSVLAPTRFNHICSRRRVALVWTMVALILIALDCFLLVEMDLTQDTRHSCKHHCNTCTWRTGSNIKLWNNILYWGDFCLGCLLPTPLIILFNTVLIYKVCGLPRPGLGITSQRGTNTSSRNNRRSSVTSMLIVASLVFVFTTLPINMYFVGKKRKALQISEEAQGLVYAVFSLLNYLNHAVNFFLYFISGSRFRQAALDLISCRSMSDHPQERITPEGDQDKRVTRSHVKFVSVPLMPCDPIIPETDSTKQENHSSPL